MSEFRQQSVPKNDYNTGATTGLEGDSLNINPSQGLAVERIPRKFGRYEIQSCIGRGGMGAVFRAHDTQLDRPVALKVPFLSKNDEDGRQRFYREARAAAALHHANICPVYDVGEAHGLPYLTMALVEGRSLSKALDAGQSFSPPQAALIVRKLALAMQEAHSRGVVHRDLKPGNILLRADGEPIVMDFGLAHREEDKQTEGLTRQGDVIGTIEYMSPEQLDGDNKSVGPQSDVYALGVVLFELLTGQRPFHGSTTAKMSAILLKPVPVPSSVRSGVPTNLDAICQKAMARKPADRYESMTKFAAALTSYLRTLQQDPGPSGPTTSELVPTPRPSSTTRPILDRTAKKTADAVEGEGWELIEDRPSRSRTKPKSVLRPKVVVERKKKSTSATNLPIILGASAFVLACLTLIALAILAG